MQKCASCNKSPSTYRTINKICICIACCELIKIKCIKCNKIKSIGGYNNINISSNDNICSSCDHFIKNKIEHKIHKKYYTIKECRERFNNSLKLYECCECHDVHKFGYISTKKSN